VAEGRVRDFQDLTIPHPSLRDTLSRWERDNFQFDRHQFPQEFY